MDPCAEFRRVRVASQSCDARLIEVQRVSPRVLLHSDRWHCVSWKPRIVEAVLAGELRVSSAGLTKKASVITTVIFDFDDTKEDHESTCAPRSPEVQKSFLEARDSPGTAATPPSSPPPRRIPAVVAEADNFTYTVVSIGGEESKWVKTHVLKENYITVRQPVNNGLQRPCRLCSLRDA